MSESTVSTQQDPPVIEAATPALRRLRFDNRFTAELTADPVEGNANRQVPGAFYSRVKPAVTSKPTIVAWSKEMSDLLGLDDALWATDEAARVFTGNALLGGSDPHAANYGGHQFGNWAGQLGDGRAIALGEVVDRDGQHQTLQLKGAGPTPYSRRADGLAVLRSSIREFLCSEAMHHLGVATTRALSLAVTGDEVVRDMFYDGHPALEPGAVVCRVAPSFLRLGSYQLPASRGETDELRQVADFTLRHYFPHLGPPSAATYAAWFDEVCRSSCDLVVDWQRVGFVHGVMNTDNISIHGLTIDYGPYGWLDDYDPDWTPNTTDAGGRRYRYGYQPQIMQWNLLQFANAIYPLVGEADPLEASLTAFAARFTDGYRAMMLAKLGLTADDEAADDALIADLVEVLTLTETDFTIFFRRLAALTEADIEAEAAGGIPDGLADAYYDLDGIPDDVRARVGAWLARYRERARIDGRTPTARRAAMDAVNPKYVLRNYLAQEAIDGAEAGDYGLIHELGDVLRRPYDEQPEAERHASKRPDWARTRPGCSMLSCSS